LRKGGLDALILIPNEDIDSVVSVLIMVLCGEKTDSEVMYRILDEISRRDKLDLTALGPCLLTLLRSSTAEGDDRVRNEICWLFGRIGASAVPGLVDALKAKDARVRATAAAALGAIGPAAGDALPELRSIIKQRNPSPEQYRAFVLAVTKITKGPEDLLYYSLLLTSQNTWLRWAAATDVQAIGPAALDLVDALADRAKKDKDASVRTAAIAGLMQFGFSYPAATPLMQEVLGPEKVADAFPNYPLPKPVLKSLTPVLPVFLKRLESDGKAARFDAIAQFGPSAARAVPALVKMLDESDRYPETLLTALGRIGPASAPAVPRLRVVLTDPNRDRGRDRINVLACLGGIGPLARAALPDVVPLTRSTDPYIRTWAAYAAIRLSGEKDPYLGTLERALLLAPTKPDRRKPVSEANFDASGEAALAFEWLAADAPELVPAVAVALPHLDSGPWSAAVRGLVRLGPKAVAAVPVLVEELGRDRGRYYSSLLLIDALRAVGPAAEWALPKLNDLTLHRRVNASKPPEIRRFSPSDTALGLENTGDVRQALER
jgi:HEAT repeat protein